MKYKKIERGIRKKYLNECTLTYYLKKKKTKVKSVHEEKHIK